MSHGLFQGCFLKLGRVYWFQIFVILYSYSNKKNWIKESYTRIKLKLFNWLIQSYTLTSHLFLINCQDKLTFFVLICKIVCWSSTKPKLQSYFVFMKLVFIGFWKSIIESHAYIISHRCRTHALINEMYNIIHKGCIRKNIIGVA